MTSKQALSVLKHLTLNEGFETCEECETIEKDLETLDILKDILKFSLIKKFTHIGTSTTAYYSIFIPRNLITEEEFKLLEELSNDNANYNDK